MKKYKLGRTRYNVKACCAHKLPLFARRRLESPSNLKGRKDFRNKLLAAACYKTFPPKGGDGNVANLGKKYPFDHFDVLRGPLV